MHALILPTQLFEKSPFIKPGTVMILYEHPVYFTAYKYHKMKLVLHRASMKRYEKFLIDCGCTVQYVTFAGDLTRTLAQVKALSMYDPIDFETMRDISALCTKLKIKLTIHDTPMFLNSAKETAEYAQGKKKFMHAPFYIWQRTRTGILMRGGKPIGGKWAFDAENRHPFPRDYVESGIGGKSGTKRCEYVEEACNYIQKYFKANVGSSALYLPIDFAGARAHLELFLRDRLGGFGHYEDSVSASVIFGNHSVLSPLMNIGLLTPEYVVAEALGRAKNTNIASLEGFIRQIIGWREYSRLLYTAKHHELEAGNHFSHRRELSPAWFGTGETKIPHIDGMVQKVLKYGYAHHIERLMYLSGYMLLTETAPKAVHDWFMMMFIDSYHVFMEPNVYGMSQHSAGAIMMNRPYISSSHYIHNMSTYKATRGKYPKIQLVDEGKNASEMMEYEWFEIYDALYYNFINNHKKEFSANYMLASAVYQLERHPARAKMLKIAREYLKTY